MNVLFRPVRHRAATNIDVDVDFRVVGVVVDDVPVFLSEVSFCPRQLS